MSLTKATGMLLLIMAAVYLLIALVNMGPTYSAAPTILDKSDVYGLNTDSTNVRFKIGGQFVLEIIIIGILALSGWWLTTQEVRQLWYVYTLGIYIVVAIVIRAQPLVPLDALRLSPVMAFYGAAVEFNCVSDTTSAWVTIPINKNYRVGLSGNYQSADKTGSTELILDFSDAGSVMTAFLQKRGQAKITGHVLGTKVIALKNLLFIVPVIRVDKVG